MSKKEMIKAVAAKTGFTQKDITVVADAAIDVITETLKAGDEVSISGFGKFVAVQKQARTMRNPLTGTMVDVPAKKAPKFKASTTLKTAVNA